MDKLLKNPINIISDLCLLAFLLPGSAEQYKSSDGYHGYHLGLGLIQPGWFQLKVDPPAGSGETAGISFGVSLVWIFFFAFAILKIIALQQSGGPGGITSKDIEEYHKTTRRPRY